MRVCTKNSAKHAAADLDGLRARGVREPAGGRGVDAGSLGGADLVGVFSVEAGGSGGPVGTDAVCTAAAAC